MRSISKSGATGGIVNTPSRWVLTAVVAPEDQSEHLHEQSRRLREALFEVGNPAHYSEQIANTQAAGEMPHGEGAWPVSWIPSSSRAARPPGMRPLAAPVRRRPAGGCGPAPASGIQPSGMHPQPGPGRARVRRRRPAPSLRVPRSRAGSYLWPVREPRRTGGRCPATAAPGHASVPGGRAPLRGAASYEAEG